ncbi:unnamed protein product [Closterium sp. NIES-65]|nr:unnamed protein product [Closterium sp. NIES-65]
MIMCPRSSSFDGAVSVSYRPSVPHPPISPSGVETPSRLGQSRLDDVGMRSLESKLELLHAQRELSALRCQTFIDQLESAFQSQPPTQADRLARRPPSVRARRASLDLSRAESAQLAQELRFYDEPARVGASCTCALELDIEATEAAVQHLAGATVLVAGRKESIRAHNLGQTAQHLSQK